MSNRKKPRNRKLIAEKALHKIPIVPPDEREIIAKTPAVIHWSQVPGIDRDDDETIGLAIMFDDETYDVVLKDDMSEDAKKLVYGALGGVDHFSIMDPEPN
jgi:hypothetical protein